MPCADCPTGATSKTEGDRGDGQQHRVRIRSLHRSAELLERPRASGLVAVALDGSTDQASGVDCSVGLVAWAMGSDLDGRCLSGIGGIRLATKLAPSVHSFRRWRNERAHSRNAPDFLGH
jgi:hypothetical protein